ncbi:TFB1 [[Candida] subhashii]|uniref:TFB1 n=1 Tax=[Candida] subhashii TaxID=561895 RepID=A0A8J5R3K9_9ASCO|nr:TFB1 [[Candida] subhashii]KAG7665050.1 TFB1 [[Candida] subhashii]
MDFVRGACSVDKVGGVVAIREDLAPSILEWKAVEEDKSISIPLNSLKFLQSTKESSPKMMLKVIYKLSEDDEEKSFKLTFTNRPTMNSIKDSLQAIVSRSRTRVEGTATPQPELTPRPSSSAAASGAAPASSSPASRPASRASSSFTFNTSPQALSDANLLKNFELQQKLLLEDRVLRDRFTKSVIEHQLSPQVFWSSRLNQLRTFALTISQHRGPYNVLSTIKPVATSDNQVNVNVTRDTIDEIFEIYPVIKKAFNDLVPQKFSEGEFWSRFFNSKLFRRLRGDKINQTNERGDVILDKYLYIDERFIEQDIKDNESGDTSSQAGGAKKKQKNKKDTIDDEQEQIKKLVKQKQQEQQNKEATVAKVHKFLDLLGNQEDNSQKRGNRPDFTMRYEEDDIKSKKSSTGENEMIILMKNMNRLSSKMMSMSSSVNNEKDEPGADGLSSWEVKEYQEELDLHDLNEIEDLRFIKINIDPNMASSNPKNDTKTSDITDDQLQEYLSNQFNMNQVFELRDTYQSKTQEIEKTSAEISAISKQNFRTFKLINKEESKGVEPTLRNLVPKSLAQEIITHNITVVEFLSHFWKLFLHENNPTQLKKIFVSLRNCKNSLVELKKKAMNIFNEMEVVKNNEKVKDKIEKDLQHCLEPMEVSLDKAINEYVNAVRSQQQQQQHDEKEDEGTTPEINEHGKRPLPA